MSGTEVVPKEDVMSKSTKKNRSMQNILRSENGTRLQKIDALVQCGIECSRKTNGVKVQKKISAFVEKERERRRASNRRKRVRKSRRS